MRTQTVSMIVASLLLASCGGDPKNRPTVNPITDTDPVAPHAGKGPGKTPKTARKPSGTAPAASGKYATVVVTGNGAGGLKGPAMTAARADCYRKAVEQAAGVLIRSRTETKDFTVVNDAILSRSNGFVKSSEVLKKSYRRGMATITMRCVVSTQAVVDKVLEAQSILKQKGYPRLMFSIAGKYGNQDLEGREAEVALRQIFTNLRCTVIDQRTFKANQRKQLEEYAQQGNRQGMARFAAEVGADLLFTGTCRIHHMGQKEAFRVRIDRFNVTNTVEVIRPDTAGVVADYTETRVYVQRRMDATSGANYTLQEASVLSSKHVQGRLFEAWIWQLSAHTNVVVEFRNLTFVQSLKLQRLLAGIEGVETVAGQPFRERGRRFDVKFKGANAQTLSERLGEKLEGFAAFKMEISEVTANRIVVDVK